MHRLIKSSIIWLFGGLIYIIIELLFRGYTHWTMFLLAAFISIPLDLFNESIDWDVPLLIQAIFGGTIITIAEFFAGVILNIYLGLNIWDYSDKFGNIFGQICPQFFFAWCGLSLIAIPLFDYIRYFLFNEEKPKYKLL